MEQDEEEFMADFQRQLISAKRQVRYMESGKMVVKINGQVRNEQRIKMLKRVIESIEKMFEAYGVEPWEDAPLAS